MNRYERFLRSSVQRILSGIVFTLPIIFLVALGVFLVGSYDLLVESLIWDELGLYGLAHGASAISAFGSAEAIGGAFLVMMAITLISSIRE